VFIRYETETIIPLSSHWHNFSRHTPIPLMRNSKRKSRYSRLLLLGHRLATRDLESRLAITPATLAVRLGLHVKATDHFAAIVKLVSEAHERAAASVSRSLLEAVVAQEFISRRTVRLQRGDRNGKSPLDCFGRKLDREFRARLYLAHETFEVARMHGLAAKDLRYEGYDNMAIELDAACQEQELLIGTAWATRLKKTKSYSGLSLRDLMYSLSNLNGSMYDSLYRNYCQYAHAADATHYVHLWRDGRNFDINWGGDADFASQILSESAMLYSLELSRFVRTFVVDDFHKLQLYRIMREHFAS
jgi:hypothetical protein